MPIIENFDGTFDLRGARNGETVRFKDGRVAALRVEKVDPKSEAWLSQRKDCDDYFRITFKTTCARCNAAFTFNRGRALARAALPKTCRKHRGLSEAAYRVLQQRGLLEKVESKIIEGKHPVFYPEKLERGAIVTFRNLGYVILNVREHTSLRSGKQSTLLDLSCGCVICGKEYPHTTAAKGRPLPLRCEACQEATGSAWRYSPVKDRGAPQYLGVDKVQPRPAYGSLKEYNAQKGRTP